MTPLLQKRVFALSVLVLAALIAGAAAFSLFQPRRGPLVSGTALVGGPIELVSHKGENVTDKEFRGKYMLVSFGYTYCPDVCPTELQVISAALDELGEKAKVIQPIFITIDPERDTVATLARYMPSFHPSYIGLTGSPAAVAKAAKAYRVYYSRSENKSGGDYLMDHSSIIYLMDKQGTFLKHFSYQTDANALAQAIAEAIDR
jgi:cytochrome oxidase Cu insertion factor (SCO1/SenC/PrrC family)